MKLALVFNLQTDSSPDQAEFDSPETIDTLLRALESGGHEVELVEMSSHSWDWIERLRDLKPDLVFNTAEGYRGDSREGLAPAVFEQIPLRYVGSGPYTCMLTLDKHLAKRMVAERHVPVADGFFVRTLDELHRAAAESVYPVLVKPNYEGSSKGITSKSVCPTYLEVIDVGTSCLSQFPAGILVENYIEGRDLAVPYIAQLGEDGVLEPFEYRYLGRDKSIYDFDLKNSEEHQVEVSCPALLDPTVRGQLLSSMKQIVAVLGIRDFARADFRLTPDGEIYFLEINALPSLQVGAGIFESSRLLGLSYDQTILQIVESSCVRYGLGKTRNGSRRAPAKLPRIAVVYNLRRKEYGDLGYESEAEFDSPETVSAIRNAIRCLGYDVHLIEADRNLPERLKFNQIDVVFNIAEGKKKRTREAQVPAVCDLLGIEHTGGDTTCLALTLDKAITKKLVASAGILTPPFFVYGSGCRTENLEFPVIVKPNHEGTSKGIGADSIVHDASALLRLAEERFQVFSQSVLCEEYIQGREFTVGLLGNRLLKVLGPMEIAFHAEAGRFPVYSFEAKSSDKPPCSFVFPVDLNRELDRELRASAKQVFRLVGCRDIARIDFRLGRDGKLYFLEINPLPGLSPGFSDLVVMAERSGLTYQQLIQRILLPAIARWRDAK